MNERRLRMLKTAYHGGLTMQPQTEGFEEQGPGKVPFVNDPQKPASPPLNDADAIDEDEAEEDAEEV